MRALSGKESSGNEKEAQLITISGIVVMHPPYLTCRSWRMAMEHISSLPVDSCWSYAATLSLGAPRDEATVQPQVCPSHVVRAR